MKIIIASTMVPFVRGGGRFIVDWLEQKLIEHGYQAQKVYLPFVDDPASILDQMLALRLLDLSASADRLIAIRPPSYLLKHPNKVLWFIHHMRAFYDLWGTAYQPLPNTPENHAFRQCLVSADNTAFAESKKIYTNSKIVGNRLKEFNSFDSEVLYPPVFQSERFFCDSYEDYIAFVCRIEPHKRQFLAVEAMRYTKTKVKLRIFGDSCNAAYTKKIQTLIKQYKLKNKVELNIRWISEEEKAQVFSQCLAAIYIPFDEDSYGYPSLEAHHAKKAVITTTDAGGTLELIQDRSNGYVVEPEPKAIAAAMDELYAKRRLARDMGEQGSNRIHELKITWDNVIEKLTL